MTGEKKDDFNVDLGTIMVDDEGNIVDYKKPYIIAAHPEVIENLKKTKWKRLFKNL